jgi:serine/threonine-protein kinase
MTQATMTLGKYKILEELGRGGFAVVYKARDTEFDRVVALKVLAPHLSWDQTFAQRFRHEAASATRLRHPNVIKLYESGEANGQLFIAMECLSGQNLYDLLEEGPLPPERAIPILSQIATALDYAHSQGLVHRDVKPSNVLVELRGRYQARVVLNDFGLVKALEQTQTLTTQGTLIGSPEYMAPEQADPARRDEIGPATDIYALGIVAYQLLVGRVPFPGNTPATLNAHLNLAPPDPLEFRPELPPVVVPVLLKALAKRPQDRYDSARELVDALRLAFVSPDELVTPVVVPLPTPAETLAADTSKPSSPPTPSWTWTLLGGAVITLAVLLFFLLRSLPGAAPAPTQTAMSPIPTSTSPPTGTSSPPTPTPTGNVPPSETPAPTAVELIPSYTPRSISPPPQPATTTAVPEPVVTIVTAEPVVTIITAEPVSTTFVQQSVVTTVTPKPALTTVAPESPAPSQARVVVKFQEIHIIDDSDTGRAGDVWFQFRVNNLSPKRWPDSGTADMESGDRQTVNILFAQIMDADEPLWVEVFGKEEDWTRTEDLGQIRFKYTADSKLPWGEGLHSPDSKCIDGCFEVIYFIEVEWLP